MKKNPLSSKTLVTRLTSVDSLSPLVIGMILFVTALILSSCDKDEDDFSADIARVVGTYRGCPISIEFIQMKKAL